MGLCPNRRSEGYWRDEVGRHAGASVPRLLGVRSLAPGGPGRARRRERGWVGAGGGDGRLGDWNGGEERRSEMKDNSVNKRLKKY
jgi:hypothetical protein